MVFSPLDVFDGGNDRKMISDYAPRFTKPVSLSPAVLISYPVTTRFRED